MTKLSMICVERPEYKGKELTDPVQSTTGQMGTSSCFEKVKGLVKQLIWTLLTTL